MTLKDLNFGPLVLGANLHHKTQFKSNVNNNQSAYLLDTHRTHSMANFDTLIPALTRNQRSEETTSEGIASAVGINDFIVFQSGHREVLGVIWLGGAN